MRLMRISNATLILLPLALFLIGGCATDDTTSAVSDSPKPTEDTHRIVVDWNIEHQGVDNFGASDCWMIQMVGRWSLENRNRLADLLFSRTKGIGLSAWRFNVGGGKDPGEGWRRTETFEVAEGQYDWTRQEPQRWFLGAAKARGVDQFIAFVNSPPRRMTRSGKVHATDREASSNLKKGYEGQFARYLADIAAHFAENPDESQRIEFDWISPVNEPQWPWTSASQEGTPASNAVIKAIVIALDRELQARGLDTKILVPESGNMYAMYAEHRDLTLKYGEKFGDYFDDFCNDPAVNDKLGNVLCAHSYRADRIPAQFIPQRTKFRAKFDEYPDWKYWMTEYCVMQGPDNEGGGGRDLTMKTALDVARVIHGDLTICNASAWQWWLAVSHYHYKDGLIYTDYGRDDVPGNEETIYPSKLLWVFGNYSRFVRPGATRIELEGADDIYGLLGSAYKSLSGDEIVLVFINMAETEKTVSLGLKGLPAGTAVKSFTPHVTSEHDDLKAYPPVNADAKYIVPPRSAVTLVGKLIAP